MKVSHLGLFVLISIVNVSLIAAEEPRLNNPENSMVIVHNPNMLGYHFYCLGVVTGPESVVVPRECARQGVYGNITVYHTPEDSDEEKNGIRATSNIDKYPEKAKAVTLSLTHPLKHKNPVVIGTLDLSCTKLWNCYYLARQQEKMVINRRSMRTPGKVNKSVKTIDNVFSMFTESEDMPELSASYIKGAVLFNARNEAVAIGYDDLSIYSTFLGSEHQFFRFDHMFYRNSYRFSGGL